MQELPDANAKLLEASRRAMQMKVGDFMTAQVITVGPGAPIGEAARLMIDGKISGLPVIEQSGRVIGIVTEHDLLRCRSSHDGQQPHWLQLMIERAQIADELARFRDAKVEDAMTRDPLTVTEDTPIEDACRLIEERGIKRLPVVRDGRLVGVVARADLIRALTIAVHKIAETHERNAVTEGLMVDLQRQLFLRRARSPS